MVTKDALIDIFKHLDDGMFELSAAIALLPKNHVLRLELGTALQKVWKVQGSVHSWINDLEIAASSVEDIDREHSQP